MDSVLHDKLNSAVWAAHSLFQRGKTAGSSANMSFRHNDLIYISASGSCFGTMSEEDFTAISLDGTPVSGKKPSKEWPLHLAVYRAMPQVGAVIHTHSIYCVLWSCLEHGDEADCIPDHTPYLRLKLGKVGVIPYAAPGSPELFQAFEERLSHSDGWLLKRHGVVVPGRDVMDAFYAMEELEESAHIAWELSKKV